MTDQKDTPAGPTRRAEFVGDPLADPDRPAVIVAEVATGILQQRLDRGITDDIDQHRKRVAHQVQELRDPLVPVHRFLQVRRFRPVERQQALHTRDVGFDRRLLVIEQRGPGRQLEDIRLVPQRRYPRRVCAPNTVQQAAPQHRAVVRSRGLRLHARHIDDLVVRDWHAPVNSA